MLQKHTKSQFSPQDIRIIEDYHGLKEAEQRRFIAYIEALKKIDSLEEL